MNILEELMKEEEEETGKKFPNAPPERIDEMRSIFKRSGYKAYCFTNLEYYDDEICVDMYIWDIFFPGLYKRFVLTPRVKMAFKERIFFDLFCRETTVVTMRKSIQEIYNVYTSQKPEMHLRPYTNPMHMLHHIYCALHRGTEEILYKANLGFLALYMDQLNDCNLIGTNPSAIFDGLPMKLLRSFDSIHGVKVLETIRERECIYDLFLKKNVLFQRKWSIGQCNYFKDVICARRENKFTYDDYMILGYLGEYRSREAYSEYIRYLEKREALKGIAILPLWPKDNVAREFFKKADELYTHLILKRKQGDFALQREYEFGGRNLEYEDKQFLVKWPSNLVEFYKEAEVQENCLWSYLKSITCGATKILFMRRKEEPDCPYITIEIQDDEICQALGKRNRGLNEEERAWLEKYAGIKQLRFYDEEE